MNNLKSDLSHLYGLAYQHGHHDTVEGGFVDCQWSDRREYFVDDVTTALSEDPECYGAITSLDTRIAELTAEVELFTALADKHKRYADAMYVGLNQVIVASMMTSDTNAIADIARNAMKDGV